MTDDAAPAVDRAAARVVLVDRADRADRADQADRVLLLRGRDPARGDGHWWFTPGGGLEPGEDPAAAARREVLEETGLDLAGVDLGPVVLRRTARFSFEGVTYRQRETFFVVVVPLFEVTTGSWTDVERRSVDEVRWWSVADLAATSEVVHPRGLVDLLPVARPPASPDAAATGGPGRGCYPQPPTRPGWE